MGSPGQADAETTLELTSVMLVMYQKVQMAMKATQDAVRRACFMHADTNISLM